MNRPTTPTLVVETREIDPIEDPVAFADPRHPLVWVRRGDGIVGAGAVVHRIDRPGAAAASLAAAWRELAAAAEVTDEVGLPGTGLVAFGAVPFGAGSAMPSSLLVPDAVIGRRGGRAWLTRVRQAEHPFAPDPVAVPAGPPWSATLGPGLMHPVAYQDAVRRALAAIDAGEVRKAVVARDLIGSAPRDADLRRMIRILATGYPSTWTYGVDGIVGASPETLVTVRAGSISARVLAGTAPRGGDDDADAAVPRALAESPKDLDEHQYAVRSVLASLSPLTSALAAAEQPFTLKLPNVWHLATDVEGELAAETSSLDLVAAMHPTAAVAGTPTPAALDLISRLEPFDRGRYAGPVGWIDGGGDGEWAIALRSAQFRDSGDALRITAHAGAGIVAGSDPEAELVETRVKFRPVVDALA